MATYEELMADAGISALLEDLRSKHPGKRLRPIDTAAGVVVCVNPSRAQYTFFKSGLWSDDKTENAKAHELLLRACVVHPDAATFAKWLDEYPGIDTDRDVVSELKILTGSAKDSHQKK
jgi:hypothetical protein